MTIALCLLGTWYAVLIASEVILNGMILFRGGGNAYSIGGVSGDSGSIRHGGSGAILLRLASTLGATTPI